MRRTPALVSSVAIVAVLSAALVGCASSPSDVSACTPAVPSGSASSLVTATGEVGSAPKVEIPAPLASTSAQRSVAVQGEGLVANAGMTVDFDLTVYDGESGDKLGSTDYTAAQGLRVRADTRVTESQSGPGALSRSLVCAQAGQRVVIAAQVADFELSLTQFGVTEKQTVIAVVDVRDVFLGKADGMNQLPQDGMPVVVTAPDGTVGVTVPSGIHVPSSDRTETVKLGSGAKLAKGDAAVLQVANWTWPAGEDATLEQKSSTWDLGKTPQTITITDEGDQALPATLIDALVGTPIGSQVLTVIAPTGDATDATIFVIDILGIQTAAQTK